MVEELQVPIHLKMTLTIKEAAANSNIGINKIESIKIFQGKCRDVNNQRYALLVSATFHS